MHKHLAVCIYVLCDYIVLLCVHSCFFWKIKYMVNDIIYPYAKTHDLPFTARVNVQGRHCVYVYRVLMSGL